MLVVGVLLPRHHHPGEHERPAARDDVHEAPVVAHALGDRTVHTAVQRHEVHAVLSVHAQHVEPLGGRDVAQGLAVVHHGVVDGHRADDGGALRGQLAAERPRVAIGGEVHDALGAHAHRVGDLLHLHVEVAPVAARAEVHVDLGAQREADAVGIEARMVHVGRDHRLALGDECAQVGDVDALLGGDGLHLRGRDALAGGVHLGCVCGHGRGLLRDALGEGVHGRPAVGRACGGTARAGGRMGRARREQARCGRRAGTTQVPGELAASARQARCRR